MTWQGEPQRPSGSSGERPGASEASPGFDFGSPGLDFGVSGARFWSPVGLTFEVPRPGEYFLFFGEVEKLVAFSSPRIPILEPIADFGTSGVRHLEPPGAIVAASRSDFGEKKMKSTQYCWPGGMREAIE